MMTFSEALQEVKLGRKIQREKWNSKVFLKKGTMDECLNEKYIFIYKPKCLPTFWNPSQVDIISNDWIAFD